MKITRTNLNDAVEEGILTSDQSERLLEFLKSRPSVGPEFDFAHLLYYLGGLIAIGAMTLFMNLGWESFGGWGIVTISLIYAILGLTLSNRFQQKGYTIPAGICATFVVALTPLAIYGVELALGLWPKDTEYREYHRYIRWYWLYMEIGTLVVAAIIARFYKYPFLLMPVAVTLWYLSMDLAVMLISDSSEFDVRSTVSMCVGAAMIGLALVVDLRSRKTGDYAFWLYLFGVMAFWGGLTVRNSDGELAKFVSLCINLLLMGVGIILVRRVFVVFGAIGCTFYLGHLAYNVFESSWLFPIILSLFGLLIIYLGIIWQKNEQALTRKARSILPTQLRELLESKDR
ncbi:hypothetical protein Pan241w_28510 [Gimesia alba]|uniref:DUF2157 domain-containing protein n=1 Tax=Gimesia alba TaxID=2527973 RepID=A0A517RFV9_9PLAN|nr:DUF2157 domain-containing protein [Gimesia alba]QDT42762.1 hypothetical protein Pan241w_28510 [Gimesia alba]